MSKREGFLDKMAKARQEQAASGTNEKGMSPLNTMAARHLTAGQGEMKRRAEEYVAKYGDGTALPCLNLDPSEIRVGRFFNRLPQSFDETFNVEFAELLEDVKRTGGNLVSGLVRPYLDESNPKIKYELVFGERRLKACIKVGVPFKAEIADISDEEFIQLHSTENRFRPQLSIVESALQFKDWLNAKTRAPGKKWTAKELADELGYSESHYFRLVDISAIDKEVFLAIPKVQTLADKDLLVLRKDWKDEKKRKLILSRLGDLASKGLSGKAAVKYICGPVEMQPGNTSKPIVIKVPEGTDKRDSLIKKLEELGAEYGIVFKIK